MQEQMFSHVTCLSVLPVSHLEVSVNEGGRQEPSPLQYLKKYILFCVLSEVGGANFQHLGRRICGILLAVAEFDDDEELK